MRAVHANCTAAFRHAGASQTCLSEAAVGKQSHVVVVVGGGGGGGGVVGVGCWLLVVCCSMGTKLLWERSNIGQSVVSNFHLSRCFCARKG